ncbi:MAG: CAP domain-containing protein [Subdoligranulum sp.]|nr:CAP domain-containing protein [Subdoligranulum sp.]
MKMKLKQIAASLLALTLLAGCNEAARTTPTLEDTAADTAVMTPEEAELSARKKIAGILRMSIADEPTADEPDGVETEALELQEEEAIDTPDDAETTPLEVEAPTEGEQEQTISAESLNGQRQTETPAPEQTQNPIPEQTAQPEPAPAPEPEPAPAPEPASTPAYGAIPFSVAAGTDKWWVIDSSDSAYWAMQEQINAVRAAGGLPALSMDGNLSAIASSRCESFVAGGPFDHSGMVTASEICAKGPLGSASAACAAWVASPGHYAQIMRTDLTSMGVGCWFCEIDGNQYAYWTVTFG